MDYKVSVIMAVYNVQPYLEEAVESLREQTIGFQNIQLILVDDGSPDESGAMCDRYAREYPDNVVVLHKENGGQSSARNLGLTCAKGKYLNFMDPDDKLSANTFRDVYDFFEAHEDETDVVSFPRFFFEAATGEPWQNSKYRKGSRVIDLRKEYNVHEPHVGASFIHSRVKEKISFDPQLISGEDLKVMLTLLAERPRLGVVDSGRYWYRKRRAANSILDGQKMKKAWYTDCLIHLYDSIFHYCLNQFGEFPKQTQFSLLCDLFWRFVEDYSAQMRQVLSDEEQQAYLEKLQQVLNYFDDSTILELPCITMEEKALMLHFKYGSPPSFFAESDGKLAVCFGEKARISADRIEGFLEFLNISGQELILEGTLPLLDSAIGGPYQICLTDGENIFSSEESRNARPCCFLGREVYTPARFCIHLNMGVLKKQGALRLELQLNDQRIPVEKLSYGRFSPITPLLAHNRCYIGRMELRAEESCIRFRPKPCWAARGANELALWKELLEKNAIGMRKAFASRVAYHLIRPFKRRKIWLISDRMSGAGGNGEALFRYLHDHPVKGIKPWFLLRSDSEDYDRVRKLGPVFPVNNPLWKAFYLLADCVISSSGDDAGANPYMERSYYYRDLLVNQKFVLLRHEATVNEISGWMNQSE